MTLLPESLERAGAMLLEPLATVTGDVAREASLYLQVVALTRPACPAASAACKRQDLDSTGR
jgi:hypothetical protein